MTVSPTVGLGGLGIAGLRLWLTLVVNCIPGQQVVPAVPKGELLNCWLPVIVNTDRFSIPRILAIRTALGKDLTMALKRCWPIQYRPSGTVIAIRIAMIN